MRQAEIVVDVIQRQLLPQPILALTQRADPSSDCRHMLTHRQVDALNECRVDLPAVRGEPLLDGLQGTEHDAVAYADQAPPAHGLDDLRIEELRQGHPAGRGCWIFVLSTRELYPLPVVREQRGQVVFEPISEKQRDAAW